MALSLRALRCASPPQPRMNGYSARKNSSSTAQPSSPASLSATTVEGTNTPFSTVFTVLRLTPIRSASSAWVQAFASRASRSRLPSVSAKIVHAALELAEAEYADHDAGADDQMDRLARGERERRRQHEQRDRHAHRRREGELHRAGAIGEGDLVVHQRADRARLEPETAREQRSEQGGGEQHPRAGPHMVDRPLGRGLRIKGGLL